jgi:hypothetical protein
MNSTQLEKFKEFLSSLPINNLDLPYFASEDTETFEELREAIEEGSGFNVEITYYSTAMEYLSRNDNSLRESLEIASEYGFELSKLNSEILASLLASEYARNDFEDLENEISTFLDELLNEEEEEN